MLRRTFAGWILGFVVAAGTAEATPRYSMAVGQNCNLCHLNPTGGGVRDPYATQYLLPTRLAMQPGDGEPAGAAPQIGENALIGADMRTLWMKRDDTDSRNNFWEMQGSVYLSLQLGDPRYSLYVHQDFGQLNEAIEVWGMGYVLPANGYVKIGRLVPAFGWKWPDHRTFSRRDFLFLPTFPPHSDTGVEIGLYPGGFALEASVTNGQFQSNVDLNDSVALAGRAQWRWSGAGVHAVLGGSWYRNRGISEDLDAVGPFAALAWGRAIWIGEFDWSRKQAVPTGTSPAIWGFVTSQELSVRLVQGLDLVGTYDLYDPDWSFATGALHRIGVGVDALTSSFLQLTGKVNFFVTDEATEFDPTRPPPPEVTGENYVQTQLQVHFLY